MEPCAQQDEGEVDDACGGGGVAVLLGLVVVLKDLLSLNICILDYNGDGD